MSFVIAVMRNHRPFAMKKRWQWKVARAQVVMGAGIRVADTNTDYHLPEKKDDEDFLRLG